MKKLLFVLFFLPIIGFTQNYDVLFIGNSYTSYNNLPDMVQKIASSFGDTINYDQSLIGGATLIFILQILRHLIKYHNKNGIMLFCKHKVKSHLFLHHKSLMMFILMHRFLLTRFNLTLFVLSQYFL